MKEKIYYLLMVIQIIIIEYIGNWLFIKFDDKDNYQIKNNNIILMSIICLINILLFLVEKKLLKKYKNVFINKLLIIVYLLIKMLTIVLFYAIINPNQKMLGVENLN